MSARPQFINTPRCTITESAATGTAAVRNPSATTNTVQIFQAQTHPLGSLVRKVTLQHIGAALPTAATRIFLYVAPSSASVQLEMIANVAVPAADGAVVTTFFGTGNDGLALESGQVLRVGFTGITAANDVYSATVEGGDF